ncbi:hypothetical protein [Pseudanabaena sp. PCC 6802]|uniref:hypothetical protein n=1 Tax=Pseudanabaena sp. PCC 6802 TaxID=118173 RepID=UPI000367AAC4|nr:hypothetical protein [Pseudanabaena sp. PCC 6802]
MRRSDRRDDNYDNERKYPRSRREEPSSPHELSQQLKNVRAQRDELQQRVRESEEATTQLVHVQQKFETLQVEATQLKESYQLTLSLYEEEKTKAIELLTRYQEVDAERSKYLTLYNEAQVELKTERKSKAGIKGWETRRKRENERLKQEIAEMTVLLHESLERKDEAVDHLYNLAERMDRIQKLVDSVEDEPRNNPIGLVQKFKRIWLAIREIIAE